MAFEPKAIDLGRDAAGRLAVLESGEELNLGMGEIGILLRIDVLAALEEERRDPLRIIAKHREGNPQENLPVAGVSHRLHLDAGHSGRQATTGCFAAGIISLTRPLSTL